MPREFDELKQVRKGIDYNEYFGEMDLTEEEIERRIKLAEEFEIVFLFFFMRYTEGADINFEALIYDKYILIAAEFLTLDNIPAYISDHAEKAAFEIVKTTKENQDEYFTSRDRATIISGNEANLLGNYNQHITAVKNNKKYKTWFTERDNKVRPTHAAVNGNKISIFKPFIVGNSELMFPRDQSLGASAEETVNCRCVAKYS